MGNGFWRGVSLGLMGWTAFGADRSGWRRSVLFVLLSMALGGIAVCFHTGGGGLALCAAVLALLGRMGLRSFGRELVAVTVTYGGRTERVIRRDFPERRLLRLWGAGMRGCVWCRGFPFWEMGSGGA